MKDTLSLYRKINVEDFLKRLDVRNLSMVGDEWNFSCPFPNHRRGDERPSAYMNDVTTAWICHGCKRRGSAINFVCDLESITPVKAIKWLREAYDPATEELGDIELGLDEILADEIKEEEIRPVILSDSVLNQFQFNWSRYTDHPAIDYMIYKRGFAPDILRQYNIGVDIGSSRITIPIHNEFNKLVGFKGRSFSDVVPKYRVLGGSSYSFEPYPTTKVIYLLGSAITKHEDIILCEGELNALMLRQHGYENSCGISGSHLSRYQANLLINTCRSIVLFFDSDSAGIAGMMQALELLDDHLIVTCLPDHEGDAATLPLERIEFLLASQMSGISAKLCW